MPRLRAVAARGQQRRKLRNVPLHVVAPGAVRIVNLLVADKRTSIRMDVFTLDAFDRMAEREGLTRHEIATEVAARLPNGSNLTAGIRLLILAYWMKHDPAGRITRDRAKVCVDELAS